MSPVAPAEDDRIRRIEELGKRRTFAFAFVAVAVIFFAEAIFEFTPWNHALDDQIIVFVTVVALVYYLESRADTTRAGLLKGNRLATIAAVIIFAAGVLAISQEYNDSMDIGDDPATIVVGLLFVVSGLIAATGNAGPPEEESRMVPELLRRRTSAFLFGFLVVVGIDYVVIGKGVPGISGGGFAMMIEGIVLLILSIIAVGWVFTQWGRGSPVVLHRTNNALLILALAVLALSVYEFDPVVIIPSAALVANRFFT